MYGKISFEWLTKMVNHQIPPPHFFFFEKIQTNVDVFSSKLKSRDHAYSLICYKINTKRLKSFDEKRNIFFVHCALIIHVPDGSISSTLAFRWPLQF